MDLRFTKSWIKALIAARGDLTKGSLMHCHAQGLHSIVLQYKPMIRLFVTDTDHDMWNMDRNGIPSTIAFHPHHCDLVLASIKGGFKNYTFIGNNNGHISLNLFRWTSKINGGTGCFNKIRALPLNPVIFEQDLLPGSFTSMKASEYHSVSVMQGRRAAWLVIEGSEDLSFEPLAYSMIDLEKWDSSNYYKPISKKQVDELIDWVLG